MPACLTCLTKAWLSPRSSACRCAQELSAAAGVACHSWQQLASHPDPALGTLQEPTPRTFVPPHPFCRPHPAKTNSDAQLGKYSPEGEDAEAVKDMYEGLRLLRKRPKAFSRPQCMMPAWLGPRPPGVVSVRGGGGGLLALHPSG